MEKLRLFIAIDIDEEAINNIKILQNDLRKFKANLKWTEPETWHITLKFLGETKKDLISEIEKKCKIIGLKYTPFYLSFKGLSAFPNLRMPRVVFIDCDGGDMLKKIVNDIEIELETLGFEKEKREFHPHLTLARIKDLNGFLKTGKELLKHISSLQKLNFERNHIKEFHLYESVLSSKGPKYIKLATLPLSCGMTANTSNI